MHAEPGPIRYLRKNTDRSMETMMSNKVSAPRLAYRKAPVGANQARITAFNWTFIIMERIFRAI